MVDTPQKATITALQSVCAAVAAFVVLAIGLIVAGTALLAGLAWALIVAGTLVGVTAVAAGVVLVAEPKPTSREPS